jgi:hypothetical protein
MTGVPPGAVTLTFTGEGVSASVTLNNVNAGNEITVEHRPDLVTFFMSGYMDDAFGEDTSTFHVPVDCIQKSFSPKRAGGQGP